jgi:hypothetical protein
MCKKFEITGGVIKGTVPIKGKKNFPESKKAEFNVDFKNTNIS